ncbi:MAG: DUF6642 family protein [Actinomycetes bacterium]
MTIFCLEGEWGNMRSRESVLPMLDLLDRLGVSNFVHRDVATQEEFRYYFDRFARAKATTYPVLYLAGHGGVGTFVLGGKNEIELGEMAEMMRGKLTDRVIYFGSCLVGSADDDELKEFAKATGARFVIGYSSSVDWLESASFDLLLLGLVVDGWRSEALYKRIIKDRELWAESLGVVVATKANVHRAR